MATRMQNRKAVRVKNGITFMVILLVVGFLAGCPQKETPEKLYPGFTRVTAPGAPGRYFLDPASIQPGDQQITFRMLSELPDGEYILAWVATDGKGNYLRTAATRHRSDDSLVETLPAEEQWQVAASDPGMQAVLEAVAQRLPAPGTLSGQIDAARAMRFLFGNFDPQSQSSRWEKLSIPKDMGENDFFPPGSAGVVKPVLAQLFEEGGSIKYLLLTQTWPAGESFDCHACAPLLSAFLFIRQEETWQLEVDGRYLTFAGKYGEAPAAQLTQIGPARFAIILTGNDMSQGYSTSYAIIMAPVGGIFYELLSLDLGGDNEGACVGGKKDKHYWAYRAEYEFVPGREAAFYDLKVTTRGTRGGRRGKIISANQVQHYVFQEHRYILRPPATPGSSGR